MAKVWKWTRLEDEESPHALSRETAAFLNRMDVRPGEVLALQQHPGAVHLVIYTDKNCEDFKKE